MTEYRTGTCRTCGPTKFYVRAQTCVSCQKLRTIRWRNENRERVRQTTNARRRERLRSDPTYRDRTNEKNRNRNRKLRHATRGRKCRWCPRDDSQCTFPKTSECQACNGASAKNGRHRCCGEPIRMRTRYSHECKEVLS